MNELEKLYRLYESDNVELMWQLSKSLNIKGKDLIRLLYKKYKSSTGDLIFNKSDKKCYLFYYNGDNHYAVNVTPVVQTNLKLNEAIELMAKALENE